jgi:hypothetical protein
VLAASVIRAMPHRPYDGGSKNLCNVGKFLPDHMVQQPKKTAIFKVAAVRT